MLSARTLAEDRARGFDVGANQYMNKPFELDELLSRVKNLLQHAAPKPGNVRKPKESVDQVQFGSVAVHFLNHELTVDGKTVRVTAKQLKLLRYFVENPGRVISRSELLREVWEISGNLQTRAVDQTIAQLRKIIEPDNTAPAHLLTVRDAGYRFLLEPSEPSPDGEANEPDSADQPEQADQP